MKLKQNSFKTVSEQFWNSFVSVSFRCAWTLYNSVAMYHVSCECSRRDMTVVVCVIAAKWCLICTFGSFSAKCPSWHTRPRWRTSG